MRDNKMANRKNIKLPLLEIMGYTDGWPRFEVNLSDGKPRGLRFANKHLKQYGYCIKLISKE